MPMKPSPELYDLVLVSTATAPMWISYLLTMIWRTGLGETMGHRDHALPELPRWAQRAHAIENLALLAP
jgi:hypothetical protein